FLVLTGGSRPGSIVNAQLLTPVIIDGEMNDSLWQQVASAKMAPIESGAPEFMGGEIHSGVMGGYLYVGAQLPEPTGHITARSIGINPNWEEGEDQLEIHISANLSPSDWVLRVNPLGAHSLERKGQLVYPEKFLVAARSDESKWTV